MSGPAPVPRLLLPEWHPQSGVMLVWPHDRTHWAPHLEAVEKTYVAIARAVCERERLLVVCRDAAHRAQVEKRLHAGGCRPSAVHLAIAPCDDTWARDFGPLCVMQNGKPRLLDFRFNAWGGKYPHAQDDAINRTLAAAGAFGDTPMETVDFVLEGGAIDTDGLGTLLSTPRCVLSSSRNPGLDASQIEARLRQTLGVRRILWLTHGALAGDDTDGHIDTLARFCDARTIVHVACDDPADEHYANLRAMREALESLRDEAGRGYRLLPLPLPRAHYDEAGQRLPATYANFLIINDAVLMPTYDDPPHDALALEVLAEAFPGREIVGIDCVPIIQQFGSLHCLTMQLPAGVLPGA